MKTIHKHEFLPNAFFPPFVRWNITTHIGAIPLTVQRQRYGLALWLEVDDQRPPEEVRLIVAGTGQRLPDTSLQYIGTGVFDEQRLVLHVFAIK